MVNLVVAKKKDGKLIKGSVGNFLPNKLSFHINTLIDKTESIIELKVEDLKAIFFVKRLEGDKTSHDVPEKITLPKIHAMGKHISVNFIDGEIIEGYTHSLHLDRAGFFMTPNDATSNNIRIFVVLSSVAKIIADDKEIILSAETEIKRTCKTCKKTMDKDWKYCPFDSTKMENSEDIWNV
ncbi:MAG: hypothetical protein A2X59_09990 [Nitrospirae bacterium GWC2_42_7]|nr:MAG: hypothetical protein A2X59_09990 [Nitrospirae bacterium GWC2_42_7]